MFDTKMILRSLVLVVAMGMVAAACAATQDDGAVTGDDSPRNTATCPEGTVDCNDTPTDGAEPPGPPGGDGQSGMLVDGGLSVADAIAYKGSEVVAVQGFVVIQDGAARLCDALAESFPPQCGQAGIVIVNPQDLPDMVLVEEGTTQWTDDTIFVLGYIDGGELTIASNVNAADTPQASTDGGIRAIQIDGVWVFEYTPNSGMTALHSGTPQIIDGCLVIDDTIVVWDSAKLDEAAAAISAAKAGESPQLLIAGGGLSLDEGTDPSQIPDAITEKCPTRAVWFAAP
ncbi:hypothetical protein MNBD_ACTINO01-2000 [hydrothermal vent metagenome]|uniref:Uncharacterized protein n=1 Tax=hydrothermal vent metagenome TaxID=652676 RepID=A0A3B0S9A8_9ZZZZ